MAEPRAGDWIQTYTGRCFWPLDPRPEEVFIRDIAHSLSMLCRYNGHTKHFYSVAEHSYHVSRNVSKENALWGLLHDAPEAYSSDIPRPLKRQLKDWPAMEARIMMAVCQRYGMSLDEPEEVKQVDLAICGDERASFMSACDREWGELPPKLGITLPGWEPAKAKEKFLSRFLDLA